MKTLNFLNHEKQQRIAYETVSLYAPLAHRLGMFQLKSQLDDLAFMFLHPEDYEDLNTKVSAQSATRDTTLAGV